MEQNLMIEVPDLKLVLDPNSGRILSAVRDGYELVLPAAEPFLLKLLDQNGNGTILKSSQFGRCEKTDSGFRYSENPAFPGLVFEIRIHTRDRFICFVNAVSGVPADQVLEWVDSPVIRVPGNRNLFLPLHDGLVLTDPTKRTKTAKYQYHPIGFPKRGQYYGQSYPCRCMMQYMADYADGKGIFTAAFDQAGISKAMEYDTQEDGSVRLSMQTFTDCDFGQDYVTPFEYVVTGFDGDWMNAAKIYRDWYESYAPPAKPYPKWFEESPVMVIYPVLGQGTDRGKHQLHPNCYYPYRNALPYIRQFNEKFDSTVLALLMHWEGTAPWAPPYVWPPLGGEELLAELRDGLHKDGNLLGLYASGTAWTQTSSINDYTQEERCRKEGLERFMMRGPKGEIEATICNGENLQRLGYDLCLSEEWSRQQVRGEIRKVAAFGTDYCQYFDQNHGGGQLLCYSREHHHPPVPGASQTRTMLSLMKEIRKDIESVNSEMVLGCESSAAEPFLNELQLNDARYAIVWNYGYPVPAQSFVFHGRSTCFSGNQCGISWLFRHQECPDNLLYRIAYAFNAGYFLSVTLKEDGLIHWCWGMPWEQEGPDQENVITLIRNLNRIRKQYPQYLLHGKMELPLSPMQCGKWTLKLVDRDDILDSVLDSSWSASDGSRIRILTNFLPQEQQATVGGQAVTVPPLSALVLENR